jgi:hypothetical protein
LKNLQFGQKDPCEAGVKEGVVVKESASLKTKSHTLHQDNRKDAMSTSQESAKSHTG